MGNTRRNVSDHTLRSRGPAKMTVQLTKTRRRRRPTELSKQSLFGGGSASFPYFKLFFRSDLQEYKNFEERVKIRAEQKYNYSIMTGKEYEVAPSSRLPIKQASDE